MMAVTVTVAADEEVYREREKKLDRNREEDFTGEKPSLNLWFLSLSLRTLIMVNGIL
ncbi:unnamed protein product [Arabidopsis thaliana]|uniref:Uncharacterized protein n=5 Tax=Arabidopsis TaxID=3701 RepID=A0A654EXN9_ARATH|nr:unnamed protein product [Arabidopsis thaliana]